MIDIEHCPNKRARLHMATERDAGGSMSEIESAEAFVGRTAYFHGWSQYEIVAEIRFRDAAIAAKARREALQDAAGRLSVLYGELSVGPTASREARRAIVLAQDAIRAMTEETNDE